jgi:hypothetical protein
VRGDGVDGPPADIDGETDGACEHGGHGTRSR